MGNTGERGGGGASVEALVSMLTWGLALKRVLVLLAFSQTFVRRQILTLFLVQLLESEVKSKATSWSGQVTLGHSGSKSSYDAALPSC